MGFTRIRILPPRKKPDPDPTFEKKNRIRILSNFALINFNIKTGPEQILLPRSRFNHILKRDPDPYHWF